ncbi:ATP-binding cassette domain-containing protein [Actinomadura opuntiae]|uniref:ATP-binding cassette domain-containing protein n=1 Tax=Actinomadura sp. OS1-43 TaxID=604315 RepID=UPI00255AEC53|nr:ABC transporter ATP-binding protein [Actinomadura sp. OS1-43]MDL4815067.1 ABC transporter ATP-binding protein [Actinomadura sp. OS1-43]
MSTIVVEARDLRVSSGGGRPVGGFSLAVPEGGVHALLGRQGAGKTLLLEALAGLRRPSGGRVRLRGADPYAERGALRIGTVWRDGGLFPGLTVTEIVEGWRRWTLDPLTVDEALALTGLERVAGVRFERLAAGERRLLDLSLAMVARSDVLFLDEPTSGLDDGTIHRIWATLRRVSAAGTTVLLATRDAAEGRRADNVSAVDQDRSYATGYHLGAA